MYQILILTLISLIKPMLKIMYFFIVNNTNVLYVCQKKEYFVNVKKRELLNSYSVRYNPI